MTDINIEHLGLGKISRDDIKKQFANDKRLDKILFIFDKINALDEKMDSTLSSRDIDAMMRVPYGKWSDGEPKLAFLQGKHDDKVTDFELSQYIKEAKPFYGDDIQEEDYRKFLGFVASVGDEAYAKKLEETSQKTGMSKEMVEKLGGAYMADQYTKVEKDGKISYERKIDGFTEIRDENGKLSETREASCGIQGYEECDLITTYDEKGESSNTYINNKTGEMTKFEYGKNREDTGYKLHIKDGVAVRQSHEYSEDDPYWRNMKLEDIVFNAGTPDSTKVSFKYDENNKLTGIDIKDNSSEDDAPRGFITDGETYLTHIPKKTTVDEATVKAIQQMIDGGARYGEDFDLKIEDGQLKVVPKIKNETGKETPPLNGEAFDRYKNLVGDSIHAGEDFDVEYDENGNFRYHLKNNQAKGYAADYKSEVYDKDGNFVSSLTVQDGEVIRETMVNGQKQTTKMPFDEAFMQLLTEKNFTVAGEILGSDDVLSGGYNIYPAAEKYKQMTGRELIGDVYDAIHSETDQNKLEGIYNLMGKLQPHGAGLGDTKEDFIKNYYDGYNQFKEVLNFDPKKSQIADMLPKIQRIQNGDNAFTETINNNSFDVKISNGQITISKNGEQSKKLDVSELPEDYIKHVFSKVNSAVFYDMASSGVQIKLNDQLNGDSRYGTTNGFYTNADGGKIVLDPNALIGDRAIKTIVHETGHMCDHIDDRDNAIKVLKERMKDPAATLNLDRPLTLQEMLDNQGTLQPVSGADEKLHEVFNKEIDNYRKNAPGVNINAAYAATNIMEFFAEAYTLLNMGTCKSEYIIANYFPETLARVKDLIEANRAQREQSN